MKKPRRDSVITVDNVARDLDTLNRRYTTLVNLLEERVRQLALLHPEDTSLLVSVMYIHYFYRDRSRFYENVV